MINLPSAMQVSNITFMAARWNTSQSFSSDYLARAVDVAKTTKPASLALMGSAAGLM